MANSVILLLIVLISAVAMPVETHGQETLRFSDMAASSGLVYPAGPNVTVRNPSGLSGVELWVVRVHDGGIVRKYRVTSQPLWKETLEVHPSNRDDSLFLKLVRGLNFPLPYLLFLIGPNREISDTRQFTVRLSAERTTPTSTQADPPGSSYLIAGKLESVKDNNLYLASWEGREPIKLAFDAKSKVTTGSGWQTESVTWINAKADFTSYVKPGDQLSVLYKEEAGTKLIQRIARVPPAPATGPGLPAADPFKGLRFQIGIVVSATEDSSATRVPRDIILETRSAARRWRVQENTLIRRGVLDGTRTDLTPTSLIAIGASELSGDLVHASQILLLKDLTETAR